MGTLTILGICVCGFIIGIYFTRWVFKIDQMLEFQKEQTKLLKNISENIQNNNLKMVEQNKSTPKSLNKLFNENYCPACKNPIQKSDKSCPNCGLVINE